MLGHAHGLDHVAQGQLSPPAADAGTTQRLRQRAGLVVQGCELLRELPAEPLALALERAHLLLEALDQLVVGAAARAQEVDGECGPEDGADGEGEHGDHAASVLLQSDGLQPVARATRNRG